MFSRKQRHRQSRSHLAGVILLSVALVFTLTGCGTTKQAESAQLPAVPVTTEKVQLSQLPSTDSYLGTVTPYIETVVSPSISGVLDSVKVRTGDIVEPGQVLAIIDTSVLQTQKGQADANLKQSEASLNAVSQSTADSVNQAQAALNSAHTNLSNAKSSAAASIDSAQKALAAAKTQLANVQANYDSVLNKDQATLNFDTTALKVAQSQIQSAQDAYDVANQQLQRAQQLAHSINDPNLLAAQAGLAAAQSNLTSANGAVAKAQAQLDKDQTTLESDQSSQTVQTAQAQVGQAQAALDAAKTAAENQVAAAQSALNQEQVAYDTVLNNPQLQVNAAGVQTAQAGIDYYQAQIDNGQITAPVGGYVIAVNAQVGQGVGPQSGIVTIASMSPLQATVKVPESSIGKIQVGQDMTVYVSATDEFLAGKVSALHPAPDSANQQYAVDVTLVPGKQQLLPGMQVEAHVLSKGRKGIIIPTDSIITMQSGSYSVFLVQKGKARQIAVQVGAMTGSVCQITSGLQVGDELVVQGQNLLSDGDNVQIVTAGSSAQGKSSMNQ
jgi:RND family efflux transporter MFP subunit